MEATEQDSFDVAEAKLEKFILLSNDKKYNYLHELKGKLSDVEIKPNSSNLDERVSKLETVYDRLFTLINDRHYSYIYNLTNKFDKLSFETISDNVEERKTNMISKINQLENKINKSNYLCELKNME